MIVVDSCVLVDVSGGDPSWQDWSAAQLDLWSQRGPLVINGIIYAELAYGFPKIETLEAFCQEAGLDLRSLTRSAFYLSGRARSLYRQRAGTRAGLLADFLIGAHAADLGCPVLTRDVARFASYFPQLELVAPGKSS
ncbi:MAG: type II toxin-antitoxin system VapC family toxin [Rhodoferax sp.]|nr:type II toxin-antitoxin system VapC family toxin [Rhodoferax sp.]